MFAKNKLKYIFIAIGIATLRAARGTAEANWKQHLMIHLEWYIHPDTSSHPNPIKVIVR